MNPMHTAPRDGTPFWGIVGNDAIAMVWHEGFAAFVSSWHRMTMAPGLTIDGKDYRDHSPVTHEPRGWLPLPRFIRYPAETGYDG
ncbi:hypothetical protein AncyloWKF20_05660 [Ancylobacter sp. WKF20]|uniref:hypothetical protein n=1 Tax=Ancylobacter sp. WKF20 TaxID=3039801 RepID=UPI00243434AC|nr:hypothetical protein [Ancylobacter sp. WKF20]WGD31312.1 hypothetical protein AncyloWKF20_05660 [Ancylobacter sp. WKF20]